MTTPDSSMLSATQRARADEAQVQDDEAKARKAAADAAMSELTLTQARYKALVPDLTGVATNAVTDKSAGVAFSGLVTHSALNHAAEVIADRIAKVLTSPGEGQPVILVTSQTDLLTSDLLSTTVKACLHQLLAFANTVLAQTKLQQPTSDGKQPTRRPRFGTADQLPSWLSPHYLVQPPADVGAPTGAAAGALGLASLGPVGLAAAAAAAIPSIISLFSSTTTVKDHTEDITDLTTTTAVLAATTAVLAAVKDKRKLSSYKLVHEDFRLAPAESQIRKDYQQLAEKRAELIFRQAQMQAIEKEGLSLFSAAPESEPEVEADPARSLERGQVAAYVIEIPEGDEAIGEVLALIPDRETERVAETDEAGTDEPVAPFVPVNASAQLSVISGAIASIDAFTTAVNATAAGARSPLAIASLNELLHEGGADGISYVLSVKGLGGRSEQYTKDRHVGFDTYTTLADASVSFMLYDVHKRRIIESGIANGVSSVHGRLGKRPKGLIGPNAADAIKDLVADAPPAPREPWWRHWPWAHPRASDGQEQVKDPHPG